MGKIFDLRRNGEVGTVKNGVSSHFSPIFSLNHIPPQPSTTHMCAMPAISPSPPPIFPIFPDSKFLVW